MPSEEKGKKNLWRWVFLALGLLLVALSAWGVLAAYSPVFLENSILFLILCGLALIPGLVYTWILKRGKPAPLLRLPYTPFALLLLIHLCVQLSGGLKSPLLPGTTLLLFEVSPFISGSLAVAVATLATLLELPALLREPLAYSGVVVLGLPWLGLLLSRMLVPLLVVTTKEPENLKSDLESEPEKLRMRELPEVDTADLLKRSLNQWVDLAFYAHPAWNAVLLLWKEGELLRPKEARARSGQLKLDFLVAEGEGVLGLTLRDKKRLAISDLSASTASTLPYYASEVPVAALLAVPFFDEDELLGVLVVDRVAAGDWLPDEISALESLGRQVAQQSQQAGYFDRMQARGRQLSVLYHVSKALSHDLDMDKLLKRLPELLKGLLPFDSYYLALRREEDGDQAFGIVAQSGYHSDYSNAYCLDENTGLGGWVLTSGEPVVFNAGRSEAAVPVFLREGLELEAFSFLLVPLMLSGRVTGLLKLDRLSGAGFSEQDREVALIFAAQAAVILEHARLYALHQRLATTDGLTGLYNHRYFQERLAVEIEVAARLNKPLSLALTDIDFFKKFNDSFGHQEGDHVLKKTAKMLKDSVRQDQDIVCRYGGEEFVVIMPDCDLVEAREVAERLRLNCAENLKGGQGSEARAITLSIGLCCYPLGAQEQRQMIHLADEALYKAKQTGRNRVCSFKDLS